MFLAVQRTGETFGSGKANSRGGFGGNWRLESQV